MGHRHPGAYLGGGLAPAPLPHSADPNFDDGICRRFTIFFSSKTSKFRHSPTKKLQLSWLITYPIPIPALCL